MAAPIINRLEVHQFQYKMQDMAAGRHGPVYSPGSNATRTSYALRILTDAGVTGEFVGGSAVDYAALPDSSSSL